MTDNRETRWLDAWYGKARWTLWLLPLALLYRLVSCLRAFWLKRFAQKKIPLPVIVVGNITVGGTGKTPLLIALVTHLQARGLKPGVVSRGYGGRSTHYPLLLNEQTRAEESGDEPLTIFQRTGCPVCVGSDRVASAHTLMASGCDILLSDDGLQHYRLGRDIEIVVVDGIRGFGNGFSLPSGPLREPVSRLASVDLIVLNSALQMPLIPYAVHSMSMQPVALQPLLAGKAKEFFPGGERVHAVAGIGNPERFFTTLRQLQWKPVTHVFPDHHHYGVGDFQFAEKLPIVMTEKDAVKCRAFAKDDWFFLQVEAALPNDFFTAFDQLVDRSLLSHFSKTDIQ